MRYGVYNTNLCHVAQNSLISQKQRTLEEELVVDTQVTNNLEYSRDNK